MVVVSEVKEEKSISGIGKKRDQERMLGCFLDMQIEKPVGVEETGAGKPSLRDLLHVSRASPRRVV